jgi:hypothetical protein
MICDKGSKCKHSNNVTSIQNAIIPCVLLTKMHDSSLWPMSYVFENTKCLFTTNVLITETHDSSVL